MVTIINHGKFNKKYHASCPACSCEFICENSDFHNINYSLGQQPWINCPDCGHSILYSDCTIVNSVNTNTEESGGFSLF